MASSSTSGVFSALNAYQNASFTPTLASYVKLEATTSDINGHAFASAAEVVVYAQSATCSRKATQNHTFTHTRTQPVRLDLTVPLERPLALCALQVLRLLGALL